MDCDHANVALVEEDLWQCRECGEEMDSLDLTLLRDQQGQDARQAEKDHQDDIKFHRFKEDQAA